MIAKRISQRLLTARPPARRRATTMNGRAVRSPFQASGPTVLPKVKELIERIKHV